MSLPKIYSDFTVKLDKKLNQKVIDKAFKVLDAYDRKDKIPRKATSEKFYTLDIDLVHRAIKGINSSEWIVCHHKEYNKHAKAFERM